MHDNHKDFLNGAMLYQRRKMTPMGQHATNSNEEAIYFPLFPFVMLNLSA